MDLPRSSPDFNNLTSVSATAEGHVCQSDTDSAQLCDVDVSDGGRHEINRRQLGMHGTYQVHDLVIGRL